MSVETDTELLLETTRELDRLETRLEHTRATRDSNRKYARRPGDLASEYVTEDTSEIAALEHTRDELKAMLLTLSPFDVPGSGSGENEGDGTADVTRLSSVLENDGGLESAPIPDDETLAKIEAYADKERQLDRAEMSAAFHIYHAQKTAENGGEYPTELIDKKTDEVNRLRSELDRATKNPEAFDPEATDAKRKRDSDRLADAILDANDGELSDEGSLWASMRSEGKGDDPLRATDYNARADRLRDDETPVNNPDRTPLEDLKDRLDVAEIQGALRDERERLKHYNQWDDSLSQMQVGVSEKRIERLEELREDAEYMGD